MGVCPALRPLLGSLKIKLIDDIDDGLLYRCIYCMRFKSGKEDIEQPCSGIGSRRNNQLCNFLKVTYFYI